MAFENFFTLVSNAGNAIYDALFWPGNHVLMRLTTVAPEFAANLGVREDETLAVFLLSLLYWFLAIILLAIVVRWCRNVARIITAIAHTTTFQISYELASAKTMLVCKTRRHFSRGKPGPDNETPMVEFDKLDFAVLKYAVARGAGVALSAPELAERFSLRRAHVDRSLNKLCNNSMISVGTGSTDGFDNYRLTQSGAAFVAMCDRRQAHFTDLHPASGSQ